MSLESQASVVFEEEQRFRQPWLWVLFVAVLAIVMATKPPPLLSVLILVFFLAFPVFFWRLMMRTEVSTDSILIRFWPVKKTIPLAEIRSAEARTYSPMGEYLGWGIKRGPSGRAYNVSGNRGVQLELQSGERILIGSQRTDDLADAIRSEMGRIR